jgi:hypothetical protein
MPSIFARLCLFVSSYFPLACIVSFLFWKTERVVAVTVLVIAAVGLVGMLTYLRLAGRLAHSLVTIEHVERIDAEATSYVVTYVIPFLALPSDTWQHGMALVILYLVLGVLYVTTNMVHINPMLNLLGFHLYQITEGGNEYALIARRRVRRGERIKACKISGEVLLAKGNP